MISLLIQTQTYYLETKPFLGLYMFQNPNGSGFLKKEIIMRYFLNYPVIFIWNLIHIKGELLKFQSLLIF